MSSNSKEGGDNLHPGPFCSCSKCRYPTSRRNPGILASESTFNPLDIGGMVTLYGAAPAGETTYPYRITQPDPPFIPAPPGQPPYEAVLPQLTFHCGVKDCHVCSGAMARRKSDP